MYAKGVRQHERHNEVKGEHGVNADVSSKKKSSRSKMSCKQCRDRKVKCDRIYPCSPCVSRGRSTECQFENSGTAVDQAQAIKNHRKQEERLLKKISELEQFIRDNHSGTGPFPFDAFDVERSPKPPKGLRVRKTKHHAYQDSLFFGTPSTTGLIEEYDKVNDQPLPSSLTHTTPRTLDPYTYQISTGHVFPCLWPISAGTAPLVQCLPPHEETLRLFSLYEQQNQTCPFPHTPDGIGYDELSRFLSKITSTAERHPSMLALIFVILAHGDLISHRNVAPGGTQCGQKVGQTTGMKGDVFGVAAAMQALRLGSFMNRPNLSSVQALLLLGPYLINTGRFLDASSLFALTVRLAQSIGLHREPTTLKPIPLTRECFTRRTVWWHILFMDQYYSSTLGRPLSVSCFGDCLPPVPLKVDDTEHRLSSFICQFTVLTTEILRCEDLSNNKIDSYSAKLLHLLDTLPPHMHFNESWLGSTTQIPVWPLDVQAAHFHIKTHTYLILMNRQRQGSLDSRSLTNRDDDNSSHTSSTAGQIWPLTKDRPSVPRPAKTRRLSKCHCQSEGYGQILLSSRAVIHAFGYLRERNALSTLDWTTCQAAFNAAYVLGMAMYEQKDFETDAHKILATYSNFNELARSISALGEDSPLRGVLTLSRMASERLGIFLRGSWNDFNASKDGHGEPDKVMDRKGMVLLEDPGLTYPTSQQDAFHLLNWQPADLDARDSEALRKGKTNKTSVPMRNKTANKNVMDVLEDSAAPFMASTTQHPAFSTSPWLKPCLDKPERPSHWIARHSGTVNSASTNPPHHHEPFTPLDDDIDALLLKAPLSQTLAPKHTSTGTNLPPIASQGQDNASISSTDSSQAHTQLPMSYPRIHPPQVPHSSIDQYAYSTYSPSWDAFPLQSQHGQSTPSSAGIPQLVIGSQSHFSTSPSNINTPGDSFLPTDVRSTCRQQTLPTNDPMNYGPANGLASSDAYNRHPHTPIDFGWSQ